MRSVKPTMPQIAFDSEVIGYDISSLGEICYPEVNGRWLPVLITGEPSSAENDVFFYQAWSAGIENPYQNTRAQLLALKIGRRIVTPNTAGQGIGSPPLTSRERQELYRGCGALVGDFATRAALAALDTTPPKVDILAASQGGVLTTGALQRFTHEKIRVDNLVMVTPVFDYEGLFPTLSLIRNMFLQGGKFLKEYRAENPEPLKIITSQDTNLAKSLLTQFLAHGVYYPRGLAKQNLAGDLIGSIDPEFTKVTIIAGEFDGVSTLRLNEALADKLTQAGIKTKLDVLKGHYHAVSEHVPYMAARIKAALAEQ